MRTLVSLILSGISFTSLTQEDQNFPPPDQTKQEEVVEASKLQWTIVRPSNLTNGELTTNYKHGFYNDADIKSKISQVDVSHFMLSQLDTEVYLHQKVGVSY